MTFEIDFSVLSVSVYDDMDKLCWFPDDWEVFHVSEFSNIDLTVDGFQNSNSRKHDRVMTGHQVDFRDRSPGKCTVLEQPNRGKSVNYDEKLNEIKCDFVTDDLHTYIHHEGRR